MIKLQTLTEDSEFNIFIEYIHQSNFLKEDVEILDEGLKDKIEFIKNLAIVAKKNIDDVVKLFMNSKVFKFFSKIKWSLEKLFELVKSGFKHYKNLISAISDFIAKSKIGKWTEDKLRQLDSFLSKHPKTRRIAGIAVAGLLIYIWFSMSFTGDFSYDFNMGDMLNALAGKFTLSTLFSGTEGMKLLLLFATGSLFGLSFPWPGPANLKFVGAVLGSLATIVKKKLRKT